MDRVGLNYFFCNLSPSAPVLQEDRPAIFPTLLASDDRRPHPWYW